ncbi:MAG TPA: glycerol kinase [Opitutae bacterium]|nr:glycerol kinase [Opitutae bacterium]
MPKDFILALDQGTTSSRAILFDASGHLVDITQKEFEQHFPKNAWVEHDANEIWKTQYSVAREVLQKNRLEPKQIKAIGITNQRETTVLWDRKTSEPIHHAIVWQDRRTASTCKQLREDGHAEAFQQKTGLRVDPYFSGTKVKWLLDTVPKARERAERGELAFGTIDCWLLWKLTNGHTHATDVTNASRTLLFNINDGRWDTDILEILDIPESILPEVKPSSGHFADCFVEALKGIPVSGIAGDQQAALFGQACFDHHKAKNTYGTGCFLLRQTENGALISQHDLLTTLACSTDSTFKYAIEGSVFTGGSVIQWLRDGLGIIESAAESEALAQSVSDNGGAYLVPAFTGLGAPHWDPHARGTLCGITRGTSAAHVTRAALESIAFQSRDLLEAINADFNDTIEELRVDGGAAKNNFLMQFQSDLMQVPVVRPQITETTALGAAYLAGLAVGYWSDRDTLAKNWAVDKVFEPAISKDAADAQIARWRQALERSKEWATD